MSRARPLRRCDAGAVAVEFALIAMAAVGLILGIVEFGRAFHMRNELTYAADLAARRILLDPTVAETDLETTIFSALTFGDAGQMQLSFGRETVDGVSFRTVALHQPLVLLIPELAPSEVTLTVDRWVPVP